MAAFTLISNTHSTKSALKELYDHLIDFSNFKNILPEDKIENFEFEGDTCSFNIKGITPLKVRIIEKNPYKNIKYQSEGLAKFNFMLEPIFIGEPEKFGECAVYLHGDMNPYIKVFAEKPLKQLVNTMSLKLSLLELNSAI